MADTAKPSSGLHVHAAPFVPGTSSKPDLKASSTPAAAPLKAAPVPAAAANGSAASSKGGLAGGASAQLQTPEKAGERPASTPGSNSKGSGGGSKGSKGGGKQGPTGPSSASKLAAAASAAPFVPSSGAAGMWCQPHCAVGCQLLKAKTTQVEQAGG